MRILLVHNRYRPAAPSGENAVVDVEAAELVARGHAVALLQRHSGDIAGWSLARRATLPVRVVYSTGARRDLAAEIERFAPDVVHVHNTFPLLTPSVLSACRDRSVPVVATVHNFKLGCASGECFRDGAVCHDCLAGSRAAALRHGCYRGSRSATLPVVAAQAVHARGWRSLVSAFLFLSAAQQRVLAPLGLPADRSFVRHNVVPPPSPPDPDETDRGTAHLVAFVGRLDTAKGADVLMRGWDAFRADRPRSRLQLAIAGAGPLEEQVRHWAAGRNGVAFYGHLTRHQVTRLLRRARAAVLPSQWEETFGLVAVEAMAVGTAPLASDRGAFPEIVTDGRDGALVAPSDPAALARALAGIDDDPARWDAYGRAALTTYRERFTPDVGMARLLALYRFAIASPAGAGDASASVPAETGTDGGIPGAPGRSPDRDRESLIDSRSTQQIDPADRLARRRS
jgi:glycosyltransferase involved in cell wall biosynthesis